MDFEAFKNSVKKVDDGINYHHEVSKTQEKALETTNKFYKMLLGWNISSYKLLQKYLSVIGYDPLLEASKRETDFSDDLFFVIALAIPAEKIRWAVHEIIIDQMKLLSERNNSLEDSFKI